MTIDLSLQTKTVLHEASQLFAQQGYAQTTLSQIADALQIPLDNLIQAYCCKECIALALYRDLNDTLLQSVDSVPTGKFGERYYMVMTQRINQYNENIGAIAALFSTAMLPDNEITPHDISHGISDALYIAFAALVRGADDAPSNEAEVDKLAMLLYTFHFLVTVFWLYDRTNEKQATAHLLDFLQDLFKLMRPLMMMPLFAKAMTKLAQIMMLVFGGATLLED